jgi:hypothetical protein
MSGIATGPAAVGTRPRSYPMSREQESLWLDDVVSDGPSRYLEHWACTLSGPLDVDALEWALGQVIERHEVLRSRFTEIAGDPVQLVTDPAPVRLVRLACPPDDLAAELIRIAGVPLDLEETPLRPWLVEVAPDKCVLIVQLHHAVVDDWSLNVFQGELMHFYEARLAGRPAALEPLPMQAGDHAVAQRAAGLTSVDIEYWREKVHDAPRSCTVPPDRPAPAEEPHRATRYVFRIDPEVGRSVRAAGRALRTTPFTVFAGALAVLLWQYGEPDEVIFGTQVSQRGSVDLDNMIGYLANTLPIRLAVSRDATFRTLIDATKTAVLGALDHRAVPFSLLVQMTRRGMDLDVPPLCDAGLVVDDMRWEPFTLGPVTAERIYVPPARAKFALHFSLMSDDAGGYAAFCDYDSDLYFDSTMVQVADRFVAVLVHCAAALDKPLAALIAGAGEQ